MGGIGRSKEGGVTSCRHCCLYIHDIHPHVCPTAGTEIVHSARSLMAPLPHGCPLCQFLW